MSAIKVRIFVIAKTSFRSPQCPSCNTGMEVKDCSKCMGSKTVYRFPVLANQQFFHCHSPLETTQYISNHTNMWDVYLCCKEYNIEFTLPVDSTNLKQKKPFYMSSEPEHLLKKNESTLHSSSTVLPSQISTQDSSTSKFEYTFFGAQGLFLVQPKKIGQYEALLLLLSSLGLQSRNIFLLKMANACEDEEIGFIKLEQFPFVFLNSWEGIDAFIAQFT